jgi:hypothetical protein
MSVTGPQPAASANKTAQVLPQDAGLRASDLARVPAQFGAVEKFSGYGLPCIKCHLYYPADLDACPICRTTERVAPVVAMAKPKSVTQEAPEVAPDSEVVEHEREEFLRQFKSQLYAAHAEVTNATAATCNLGDHSGEPENAEVCKTCFDHLQERVDVCEAALHIDLKEAAQIIYDAVWADPSDPSKTYQNAANALLSELRKRAGVTTVLGPFQPLADQNSSMAQN